MSFADSFWTQDYNLGFRILFDQLQQGIYENEEYLQLFTKRMELEHYNGNFLKSIEETLVNSNKRFSNDDYISSTKNSFKQLNENFSTQGEQHLDLASRIQSMILTPFGDWAEQHKTRVKYSEGIIFGKYKEFNSKKSYLEKLQKRYFNKCRLLEEFKSRYTEDELDIEQIENEEMAEIYDQTFSFGGKEYNYLKAKELLTSILSSIEITSYKVPILGTYNNCSTGSSITQWLLDNVPELQRNIILAENFAQDLLDNEFIKIVGTMNNKNFINSSKYYYQWKPIVFEMTRMSYEFNNQFSDYFEDVKQVIGVNTINFNDKSQLNKLIQEINVLDNQYFLKVVDFDKLRCEFEEIIFDHLTFMERCELDRLKAIKKVIYDFSSMCTKSTKYFNKNIANLTLLEETIHPINDLNLLIENFQTGRFNPRVVLYDNYYNSNTHQNFGIDLNTKSRLDKKIVPALVQSLLLNLDKTYPNLENDEERIGLWVHPVNLSKIHELRSKINNLDDNDKVNEILSNAEPILLSSLLKLYLYELPDTIISSSLFDLIKSLYQLHGNDSDSRINGLRNILGNLPKSNLATLDSILMHLSRLIKIVSKKNDELAVEFKEKLSKELSHLVLKPKINNNDNNLVGYDSKAVEKLQNMLLGDLFEYKNLIFDDLRRRNSKPKLTEEKEANGNDNKSKKTKAKGTKEKIEDNDNDRKEAPLPETPKTNALKRSTSPNKKKLSKHVYESGEKSMNSSSASLKSATSGHSDKEKQTKLSRKSSIKSVSDKLEEASLNDS